MELSLHPRAAKLIEVLQADPPQSLLLHGLRGVGVSSIARKIAGDDVLTVIEPLDAKGNPNEGGTISVEAIRELYIQTRARFTQRKFVIIDNAERMNHSSQSAFLKLLEEPNPSIYFILVSHQPELLKATIRSRVQAHVIPPITAEQSVAFVQALGVDDVKKQAQLSFIAGGLPAELSRLVSDDDYFQQRAGIVGDARTFLQGTLYEKIGVAQLYHSDRTKAIHLIDASLQIARRSISSKPQLSLVTQMDKLLLARERISGNGNIRLVLADTVMS